MSDDEDRADKQATLVREIKDLGQKIRDLEARFPAHSVPVSMMVQLEELEEMLERKRTRLKQLGGMA